MRLTCLTLVLAHTLVLNACAEPERTHSCSDDIPVTCDLMPTGCGTGEVLAQQDGCYRCVNPATCLPWGEPICTTDSECDVSELCDGCVTSSCPACDDCLPGCIPHTCPSGQLTCRALRPDCGAGAVAVVGESGCWQCVTLDECLPIQR